MKLLNIILFLIVALIGSLAYYTRAPVVADASVGEYVCRHAIATGSVQYARSCI